MQEEGGDETRQAGRHFEQRPGRRSFGRREGDPRDRGLEPGSESQLPDEDQQVDRDQRPGAPGEAPGAPRIRERNQRGRAPAPTGSFSRPRAPTR